MAPAYPRRRKPVQTLWQSRRSWYEDAGFTFFEKALAPSSRDLAEGCVPLSRPVLRQSVRSARRSSVISQSTESAVAGLWNAFKRIAVGYSVARRPSCSAPPQTPLIVSICDGGQSDQRAQSAVHLLDERPRHGFYTSTPKRDNVTHCARRCRRRPRLAAQAATGAAHAGHMKTVVFPDRCRQIRPANHRGSSAARRNLLPAPGRATRFRLSMAPIPSIDRRSRGHGRPSLPLSRSRPRGRSRRRRAGDLDGTSPCMRRKRPRSGSELAARASAKSFV